MSMFRGSCLSCFPENTSYPQIWVKEQLAMAKKGNEDAGFGWWGHFNRVRSSGGRGCGGDQQGRMKLVSICLYKAYLLIED